MKKLTSIILALAMCLSLAACGGESQGAVDSKPDVSESITETVNSEETSSSSQVESLPMGLIGAYNCTISGCQGTVMVTSYEVYPDNMNEGCEIRTAAVSAVFNNAPEDFELNSAVFPLNGSYTTIDDGVWLTPVADGDGIIMEYDNCAVYSSNENGVYRCEMLVTFVVPEGFDEIAFALTDSFQLTDLEATAKSDFVFDNTRWFVLGSLNGDALTYNGNAIAVAQADGNPDEFNIYGTPGDDSVQSEEEIYDEPYEEQNTTSASGYRTLELIQAGAITECSAEGRTISFAAIDLAECYEDTNVINVTVNYSGHQNGDIINSLLFDAYNEVHLDEQNQPASGNGSVTFSFSAPAATAPYTFSVITMNNGNYIQNNIHIDADVY